ncbi:subtilisin-like protease SBT4.6 [Hibiscus syriacus]|uniref:subtilisin-like protease SBT4.6 n=1 Tax=Hibiscus syriacus TaxID=106335 RepID=UPI0019223314|nr:subtilisin-like protease SBT4.6 [Hibiscus syriacus]
MRKSSFLLSLHISVILMLCMSLSSGAVEQDRKVYIAYMGSLPEGDYSPSSHHFNMLQSLLKRSSVGNYITRSYRRSFNGFAAKLTDEEAKKLASFKGVVSVFPNKVYQLQTTRSWDFMGFSRTVKRNPTAESNAIIGVLDTGIWPESDSFSDEGFGPPPKKWKGSCNGGLNFTCNNKVIGARAYETDSARDTEGHGSHTASTAAGNIVDNANFFGFAEGTARGGVPSARIAVYKVCGADGCTVANILAGFDDAVADGVDILTVSLGSDPSEFYSDPVAIGAYHAAEKGILVMQSAGNSGASGLQSVSSVAPWILSVAASTMDRLIIDNVVLGNGNTLIGYSVNSFTLNRTKVPLVYGSQASTECDENSARACSDGCLDSTLVKNKIVVCDNFRGLPEARRAGALGSILQTLFDNVSFVVPFPASALSIEHYKSLKSYLNSTEKAVAEILRSETIEDSTAPVVAAFSSRGPSVIVPDILKPDISAPGVDILAAFSPVAPPSSSGTDERRVKYNIISGTSMSCPHVAALAAYVKTFHPDWSPSAIKSALMTTASPMDPSKNPNAEFGYGSGHVNPVKAINPGLVYDNAEGENLRFLCGLGYDEDKIRAISGTNVSCPKTSNKMLPRDFNYPTLSAQVKPSESFIVHFRRTVTNVGTATSTYNAKIFSESKLEIEVIPKTLSFESLAEKKTYNVTVKGRAPSEQLMASASLTWSDGIHMVRSPIVIHTFEGSPKTV